MRSKYVMKNSLWSVTSNIVSIIMGFISRSVFIYILGEEYLGINGLFTNILSLLSLAELGFGSAVTYNLYKPIVDNDERKIAGIMNFYKWIYRVVAIFILIVGSCVIPVLQYIIKDSTFDISYIRTIYVFFLLDTVVSYLYSYNFTLASADQKGYYTARITAVATPIINIAKIVILWFSKSFIAYLLIGIVLNFATNIIKTFYVRSKYSVLRDQKTGLSKIEKKKIFTDVKNIFAGKVSTTILNSTDSIVISSFISVITVGLLSNYNMLIGYVQGTVNMILFSAQASIGNIVATETKEYTLEIMEKITYISCFISSFACVCLYCLSSDFISLLWGTNLVMDNVVVFFLMTNSFMQLIKSALWMTLGVCGFFDKDKYISMIGAAINIIVSVILAIQIGVIGVILGTLISQSVQMCMKSKLLFNKYFGTTSRKYLLTIVKCFFVFFLELGVTALFCEVVSTSNLLVDFIIECCICLIIPNVITIILFRNTPAYKYIVEKIVSLKRAKAS